MEEVRRWIAAVEKTANEAKALAEKNKSDVERLKSATEAGDRHLRPAAECRPANADRPADRDRPANERRPRPPDERHPTEGPSRSALVSESESDSSDSSEDDVEGPPFVKFASTSIKVCFNICLWHNCRNRFLIYDL